MELGETQCEQGGSYSRKREKQVSNSNNLMINKYKKKLLDKEASLPNSTIPQNSAFYTVVHFCSSSYRATSRLSTKVDGALFERLSLLVFNHQNLIIILICLVLQILIGHQFSLRYRLTTIDYQHITNPHF